MTEPWTKQMKQQLPDVGQQAYRTVIPEEKKQGEPYDYPSLLHGEVSSLWDKEEEPIQNPEVLPSQRHRDQHLERPRHLEFVRQSTVEEGV